MKTSFIMTDDGRTEVQWWKREHFQGRQTKIYGGDSFETMTLNKIISIPDNLVICDFCNDKITEYPVPVLWQSYALCPKCFKEVQK